MTNSVIKIVQAIEADYGMDSNNWPENDVRLKKLREWYIKHSDEKREIYPTEIFKKSKNRWMNKYQRKKSVRYLKLARES